MVVLAVWSLWVTMSRAWSDSGHDGHPLDATVRVEVECHRGGAVHGLELDRAPIDFGQPPVGEADEGEGRRICRELHA